MEPKEDGTPPTDGIQEDQLASAVNTMYNLLLGIGIIVAMVVGIIIGIKYTLGSLEEKADLKQSLIAFVVGSVVIFGAFGIWKIVMTILT